MKLMVESLVWVLKLRFLGVFETIYKFNGPHRMVLRICLNILKILLILLLFVKRTSTLIYVEKFK